MSFHSPNVGRGQSVGGEHGVEVLNVSLSRSASDAGGQWNQSLNATDDGTSADVPDGVGGDVEKTRQEIQKLQEKYDKTMSKLRLEQADKEENVQAYLQALTSATDKHQQEGLKAMFEKRNNKTSQTIWYLQRKLDTYERRINDLRRNGAQAKPQGSRQPKEVLKDVSIGLKHVSGNIKDGITGLSGTVMSKPREFAHLIRNKFGSADNITSMQQSKTVFYIDESPSSEGKDRHGSSTLPARLHPQKDSSVPQTGGDHHQRDEWRGSGNAVNPGESSSAPGTMDTRGCGEDGSVHSEAASSHLNSSPVKLTKAHSGESSVHAVELLAECHALRASVDRIKEDLLEHLILHSQESNELGSLIEEDRARMERHEEELNEVIDFHQKSVENVRTSIATMEERLQYQMNERLRDLQDLMEACSNRVSRLEHQYAQHAQVVSFDNIQNRRFRAMIVRLVNFCLGILQLVLFTATIVSDVVTPFVRTRYHVIVSAFALAAALFGLKKWSRLADFAVKLWRKKKNDTIGIDPVVVPSSSALSSSPPSTSLSAGSGSGHCYVSSLYDLLLSRCPLVAGCDADEAESFSNPSAALAKQASSSSLTTAAVLLCCCSFALVAVATLGTRGLRLGIMLAVLVLALGVVLPL